MFMGRSFGYPMVPNAARAWFQISPPVEQYIVDLANATRNHREAALGVSPRASLNLMKGAKAMAMVKGRDFVTPTDVQDVARSVMSVRLIARSGDNAPDWAWEYPFHHRQ